jgi:hypothetical protein
MKRVVLVRIECLLAELCVIVDLLRFSDSSTAHGSHLADTASVSMKFWQDAFRLHSLSDAVMLCYGDRPKEALPPWEVIGHML